MKKSLFVLGVAVAALASCTNEEVTEVAQNRVIGFNSFVNNNTKAVTELDKTGMGDNFYVLGYYSSSSPVTAETPVFENEISTTEYYWQANNYYQFGAYSNGGDRIASGVTFTPGSSAALEIQGYTVNDSKDLVAALSDETHCTGATENNDVNLSFEHLLSRVRFTFNTKVGGNYTLKIFDLQFSAAQQGNVTYASSGATWSNLGTAKVYDYEDIDDLTKEENFDDENDIYTTSVEKMVIPQNNTNSITVSFKATINGGGLPTQSDEDATNFTSTLAVPDANVWNPGYIYNYVVTINGENIDPDLEEQIIKFNVVSIEDWQTTDAGNLSLTNP